VPRSLLSLGVTIDAVTGHARMTFNTAPHAIGSPLPELRTHCERVSDLLTSVGLATHYVGDIERCVWIKGVVNAATNPVAALINGDIGQLLDSPSRMICLQLLEEGRRVAAAHRLDLDDDLMERTIAQHEAARDHIPSMAEDTRNGRESEIDQLNEQIIMHARTHGIPVLTHELIDALISTIDWRVYRARTTAAV